MNNINRTELSDWVRQYTKDLLARAFSKTAGYNLSEDLVQETFLAAAENFSSFNRESQPKTWLIGILKNKIAEHFRQALKKNITTSLSPEQISFFFNNGSWLQNARSKTWGADAKNLTDDPAFNTVFDQCIEHLPVAMSACIRLKFLDEKKGNQICEELAISPANYWQLIHRAKLQLRSCLDKNWFKHS